MPNPTISPKAFAIILLASIGKDVSGFIVQIPEQLLMEASQRAVNFGIQYGAIAIGECVAGSKFVDVASPAKLFVQGFESLATASSPEEAATKGTIAAAVLVLSAKSSQDPNASLAFGGFLIILAQNVLMPGSQIIFSNGLFPIYVIYNILIRVVTEIKVEKKRRELKLPFKFNIFKKEKRENFVFKYPRFKKRKFKFLSRDISLPVVYQKELIIKAPVMVRSVNSSNKK